MAQVQREASRAGSATYWPGLDGVRAFAVLSVMAYHLGRPEASGGYLGVDMFFVLSGFLITDLLLRENERRGGISLRLFYIRRALRLLPALSVVVVLTAVAALVWTGPYWSEPTIHGLPFVVFYAGNWARAFGDEATLGLLVHTWSLAIEEQFYLLWPLVVLALTRRMLDRRVVVGGLLMLSLAVIVLRFVLTVHGTSGVRTTSGLDTHSDGLLIGAALAFALHGRSGGAPTARARRDLAVLTVVGCAVLVALIALLRGNRYGAEYGYAAAALATAALLLGLATGAVPLLTAFLESRPLVWVGRRSYGLYLWHFPLFLLLADRDYAGIPGSVVALVAVLGVAAASYRVIEEPFLRLKSRFARVPTPSPRG